MWIKDGHKFFASLPSRGGSVPLSESGPACDGADKGSTVEATLCLFIRLPEDRQLPAWSPGALHGHKKPDYPAGDVTPSRRLWDREKGPAEPSLPSTFTHVPADDQSFPDSPIGPAAN